MTAPIEAAIVTCVSEALRSLRAREIQDKLKRAGHNIGRDDLDRCLAELTSRGVLSKDSMGWRCRGNVRSSIALPPSPVCDARTSAPPVLVPSPSPSPAVTPSAVAADGNNEDCETDGPSVTGGRWQRLRRLLAYYQECLVMEDAPEIRGFLNSIHDQWLPVVGSVPWEMLAPQRAGFAITLQDRQGRFQANRARRGEDMSLYLGYPVKVVKLKGKADEAFAVPIFVQPVEADWEARAIRVRPDGQPTVNAAWASYAFKERGERDAFFRLIGLTGQQEGHATCGIPSIQEMASRMGTWFGDTVRTPIAPGRLDDDQTYERVETGIYNRAVLMLGPKLKFTKSLLRELREIASWPDTDIEKSALRYLLPSDEDVAGQPWHWSPHRPGWGPDRVAMTNILFGAQREAVVSANSRPVTVITGPPGTGKSEVVRAILINQLLRERPTLMASRNHGAIEAVVPRLNELGNGEPVVIRASSPDLRARNGWKDQLKTLLSRPQSDQRALVDARLNAAAQVASELAVVAKQMRQRMDAEATYAEAILRAETSAGRAAMLSAEYHAIRAAWRPNHAQMVRDLQAIVGTPERPPNWLQRLLDWLRGRRRVSRQELLTQIVAGLPPTQADSLDQQVAIWRAVEEASATAKRLSEIEHRLAALPTHEGEEEAVAGAIIALRERVHELLRMLAGGAAAVRMDHAARQRMRNLWAGMENFGGKKFNNQLRSEFPNILAAFPLWSVTNLSVKSAIPLLPGAFDLVVIDEASQCDIPSVVPLLARARRAAIVGDPMQLTHITKLAPDQEQVLMARHCLTDFDVQRFSYRINSCYGLGEAAYPVERPILLDIHLRCHAEIADFAGTTFYRGGLQVGTDHGALKPPPGKRAGIHWTDVVSSIESSATSFMAPAEVAMCVQVLRELQDGGYTGTVGVVTPFRPQATRIGDAVSAALRPEVLDRWDFLSATAHGFQGDERDLMIYSLCCGEDLSPTSAGWLASSEGRCLMNVAMTRARAVLHIIGNQSWAETSGIPHLASLARTCRARAEHVKPATYESVWEERFDQALRAAGISTVCQHPVAHRRLDLAVLQPVKLDIEVDGESTHRAANGRRKDDDTWRDIQMTAMGWKVLRFWVYELREDMAGCVQRVRQSLGGVGLS